MSMGSAGLANSPKPNTPGFWDQIAHVAADPKGFSERFAKLSGALKEQQENIQRIDAITQENERVLAAITQGKTITEFVEAEQCRAKEIIAEAQKEVARLRAELKQEREEWLARNRKKQAELRSRERDVEAKEDQINPVFDEAQAAAERAEAERAHAERTRRQLEEKATNLKNAVREALR